MITAIAAKPLSADDPLAAVQRGETVPARIHDDVLKEDAVLEAENLRLWYGSEQALHSVSIPIPRDRVTALIGPSGCGKSTFLRCANRMTDMVENTRIEGDLRLDGSSIYGADVDVIELRKRMGMVFQKPTPFPMSVYENVVYPLRIDGETRKDVLDEACEDALRAAALWNETKDRLDDLALNLSDGQQQRLCIARAVVARPEILLMDEPCSALDPIATGKIEELLDGLRGELTILIVTHNLQQASRAADFTAYMHLGRVIEFGASSEIFTNPKLRSTEDYITGRHG